MSRYNNTTFKSKLLFIDIFNKLLDSDIHPDVFFFFDSDKKNKEIYFCWVLFWRPRARVRPLSLIVYTVSIDPSVA